MTKYTRILSVAPNIEIPSSKCSVRLSSPKACRMTWTAALGISANSSSPRHIATILGLEHDLVMRIAADFHLLLEGGDESSDIKIRQPSFLEFLLDFSRSQELFVDVNEATLRAIFHAEGMYVHPLPRTLIFMSLHQCFPWSLQIYTQAKT